MFLKLFKHIVIKHSKHTFDLSNPDTVIVNERFSYQRFHCKKCDKTLCLDYEQMINLPYSMSHGCAKNK